MICCDTQAVAQFWIMPRHFNTTGPCKPNLHYMLPPTDRLPNLERVLAKPILSELVVRTDDALRVQRVLQHWVETAKANTDESLKWTIGSQSNEPFQIMRMGQLILKFDRNSRILSTELTISQLKTEFNLMTHGVISCQLSTLPIHETARHIFLRSTSFTESSIHEFLMHMLSIKKVGSYTQSKR
jgi:hypothetical protein